MGPLIGFTFRARKNGDVHVFHHGTLAATLRGARARRFLLGAEHSDPSTAQLLMARVTGNYKRGSERDAASHPRHRR